MNHLKHPCQPLWMWWQLLKTKWSLTAIRGVNKQNGCQTTRNCLRLQRIQSLAAWHMFLRFYPHILCCGTSCSQKHWPKAQNCIRIQEIDALSRRFLRFLTKDRGCAIFHPRPIRTKTRWFRKSMWLMKLDGNDSTQRDLAKIPATTSKRTITIDPSRNKSL